MKIQEVSKIIGFSASTIRYYEQQGLIREVERDKHGIRNFSEDDLKWIKFLASYKKTNLSLNEMMALAELHYSKNESIPDRLAVTMKYREKVQAEINQLQEGLNFIDCKIGYYKRIIEREERENTKIENDNK